MLNILSYVPKHVAIMVTLATALLTTFTSFAAADVRIEGNLAVANYSRGDTSWDGESVDASYDEVVRFKIYYHNTERPDSGKIAENLSVDVDLPSTAGSTQTVTATIMGDNTNTVTDTASVNFDRDDAFLEFVPGSVEWSHNTGTRENTNYETIQLADNVVTGDGFVTIEDQKPCFEFEAWITFAARVRVPSVSIEKQAADQDEQEWTETVTSAPGEEVRFLLTVRNNGNARVNDVTLKDTLPEGLSYVAGSTKLFDSNHPNGGNLQDGITTGQGINIGDLPNDTEAYVTFRATVDDSEETLDCGLNTLTNRARVIAVNFNGVEDTASVKTTLECEEPEEKCEVTGKTHLAKNDPNCKEDQVEKCEVEGKTHLPKNDPNCKEDQVEKCEVTGKTHLAKDDPNCKETPETPVELPNTGAGSALVAIFGAISASAAGYGFVQNRRLV